MIPPWQSAGPCLRRRSYPLKTNLGRCVKYHDFVAGRVGQDRTATAAAAPRWAPGALQGHPDCLIIRTSWLFDRQGPSFFSKIEQGLKTSGAVSVVNDQWGAPTWARDLAHASLILLRSGQRGLIHFSSLGEATWYELACYYVRLRGLQGIVTPTATGPSDVPRPRYSVLDQKLATSLEVLTHLQRSWQQTLAACFAPDLALPGAEVDPLDGASPKPMQGFAHHSARVADPG